MGKQKSFIIVGSTFVGIILLIVLVALITRGIKDTKCNFETQLYAIEVGKSKALAPTIYAGGVVKDIDFTYTTDKEGIITILEGTYSSGAASVHCWVFTEPNEAEKESYVPHNEEDVISIKDGYWYINNTKTICKASSDYAGEDLNAYATRSVEPRSVMCYILNGIQTDIPFDENVIPVRDQATGNWFIDGKDTGYSYKGFQVTIIGEGVGSTQLTAKGVVDGEEVSATTTVQVCLPNPKTVTTKYVDNTIVTTIDKEIKLDGYEVNAKTGSLFKPSQDVTFTLVGQPENITLTDGVVKATAAGEYKVRIAAARSSFTEGIGQYETVNVTVKIIVLDTTEEQIELIELARTAIENIGTVEDTAECRALVAVAREAVSKVLESNISGITNIETLEKAEKKLNK